MIEVQGKYGTAKIFNDTPEEGAIAQVINLLNHPISQDANVRIMPDVHAGAGCVIGYTAKLTDKVVPNLIGVDIGCGVTGWKLGHFSSVGENFDKLDKTTRKYVPSGRNSRARTHKKLQEIYELSIGLNNWQKYWQEFKDKVNEICDRMSQNTSRVWDSIGTLGGGNHFIEIDKDGDGNLWLMIHSGSRNFGLQVAKWHQKVAEESLDSFDKEEFDRKVEEIKQTKKGKGIEVAIQKLKKSMMPKGKVTGLEYLEGKNRDTYVEDMKIAQIYAQLNRRVMGYEILTRHYNVNFYSAPIVESVHNYINFEDGVVRKGSISAHAEEQVIIPLNMADGTIIGTGRGNFDWNNSAPHGAGRKMSRSKAKEKVRLEDFQKVMHDSKVWTSCVSKKTLDESPQAYKKAEEIIEYLEPTVNIDHHAKPVYNFKASE